MPNRLHAFPATAASVTDALLQPSSLSTRVDPSLRRVLSHRMAAAAPSRQLGTLRLDSYVIDRLLSGNLEGATPFSWSPKACRRILGSIAIERCFADSTVEPLEAVTAELLRLALEGERRLELSAGSLARWAHEAPPSLKAAVIAEATSYATEVLASIELDRLGDRFVASADPQWVVPGAPWVSLRGRRDLEISTEIPGQRAILALRPGVMGPQAAEDLATVALASSLARPDAPLPARIIGLWGASGRALRLEVRPETLKGAARRLLGSVEKASGKAALAA